MENFDVWGGENLYFSSTMILLVRTTKNRKVATTIKDLENAMTNDKSNWTSELYHRSINLPHSWKLEKRG